MTGSNTITGFMEDPRLNPRVKIENYLLVHLELRPCSQTTLPAELPDAEAFGTAIDERVYPKLSGIRAEASPRKRRAAIDALKRDMRAAFEEIVEASDQYRAHLNWAEALGLNSRRFMVRPTVQELYLFRDRGVEKMLKRLMKRRERLRQLVLRHPPPDLRRVQLAYPEEFQGDWLREIGDLLGYPSCCVERYASDREKGVSVEERASRQIQDAEKRGVVDPLTYFVGYFFPCHPDCEAAISKGREYLERLRGINPELGALYKSVVAENMDRVRRQPEIIAEYRSRATEARRRWYNH